MPVKKKVGVKKLENRPKSGCEIVFCFFAREKIEKMAFTGTFFFTGKKKHCVAVPISERKNLKFLLRKKCMRGSEVTKYTPSYLLLF